MVGVDGSPISEAALAYAFEAADARSTELAVVHAWHDLLLDQATLLDDAIEQQAHAELFGTPCGVVRKYPDLRLRRVVVRDSRAKAIVEQSMTAQLVVLGSHERGSFDALLLGSVSSAVLHRADCPVVVVRAAVDKGA